VPVQDKSAREALQTFVGGKGDVMIAYENEAITAQQKDQQVDYTIPDQTIQIENPIAITTKSKNPTAAKAFVDYLLTPQAQQVFVDKGYRPVNEQVAATANFPKPSGLFTIADLGGWSEVNKKFFDKQAGLMAGIEQKIGVSVGS
jgi:sulfate transport system substrate-binding protein